MARPLLLGLSIACLVTAPLAADWIVLKDGIQIHGTIIRETQREVALKSDTGGTLTFRMNQVAEVHRIETDASKKTKKRATRPAARSAKGVASVQFGDAVLSIPHAYEQMLGRGRYPGYLGELLGLYNDPKHGTKVSVTQGPLPFKARGFVELKTSLRRFLNAQPKYDVIVFERRDLDDKPTVYAEFREKTDSGAMVHVQAWVLVSGTRLYSVGLSVPDGRWALDPYHYREMVASFHYREGSGASKDAVPIGSGRD